MKKNKYSVAVIPGDGIGKEVVPEGLKVLSKVSSKYGINFEFEDYPFASADFFLKEGEMLPKKWKETLSEHDAIFFCCWLARKSSRSRITLGFFNKI